MYGSAAKVDGNRLVNKKLKGTMKLVISIVLQCAVVLNSLAQLRVGDPAPELQPYRWILGAPVEDFKRDRLYLVEFGATWCKPCTAAIPVLSSIAKRYADHVTVASVFVMEVNRSAPDDVPSYLSTVQRYVEKKKGEIQYAVAVDDASETMRKNWIDASGRVGIPQIFIVDHQGNIAWMGANPSAAEVVLKELIANRYAVNDGRQISREARNVETNASDTLVHFVLSRNGEKAKARRADIYVRSPFGKTGGHSGVGKIEATRTALSTLYYLAYGDTLWNQVYTRDIYTLDFPDTIANPFTKRSYAKYWYVPLVETSDPDAFGSLYDCYLKIKRPAVNAGQMQAFLQKGLVENFHYEVVVEERDMPCWNLVVKDAKRINVRPPSTNEEFKYVQESDGRSGFYNATTQDIIWILGSNFGFQGYDYGRMPKAKQYPFVDRTGIDGIIDFHFRRDSTFEDFRKYLNDIGFDVVEGRKRMKVVVIRDPAEAKATNH